MDSGKNILSIIVNSPAPSIIADSSNSLGICLKKLRRTTMLKIATPPGMIIDQIVLSNPVRSTTKYVGISPPPISIVVTKNQEIIVLPFNTPLGFDNGYAVNMIKTIFMVTPTRTLTTEFHIDITKRTFENAYK
jgi:hypothetical protein